MNFLSSRAQLLLAALMMNAVTNYICEAQAQPMQPMCGGDPYDPTFSMCCDTGGQQFEVVPIELPPESMRFAKCCGDVIIDNSTTGCCTNEPFPLAEGVCCGNELHPVDPTVMACCGEALYEIGPMANCCAGRNVYDLTEEICCAGQVIGLPATSHMCCGTQALPISGAQQCCGPRTIYDSTAQVCCPDGVFVGQVCPTTQPPTTTPTPTNATTNASTTAAPATTPEPIDLSPLAENPSQQWGAPPVTKVDPIFASPSL